MIPKRNDNEARTVRARGFPVRSPPTDSLQGPGGGGGGMACGSHVTTSLLKPYASSLTSFEQVKGLESRTTILACGNHAWKRPLQSRQGRGVLGHPPLALGSLWQPGDRCHRYCISTF